MNEAEWLKKIHTKIRLARSGCWEWQGARNAEGYGHLRRQGADVRIHRLVYQAVFGDIPGGLFVLHACDNPACCNPAHLFLGTHDDNMRDMARKGRWNGAVLPGERNGRAILTEGVVVRARQLSREIGVRSAARLVSQETGVSENTLRGAIRGKTWRHL